MLSGGALYVDGGDVTLGEQTFISGSAAPIGSTISIGSGSLLYRLPAPLGRYVSVANDATNVEAVQRNVNGDYPYACNAGSVGDSLHPSNQSTPQCAGYCAAGYYGTMLKT